MSIVKSYKVNNKTLWKIDFTKRGIRIRSQGYVSRDEALALAMKIRMDILTNEYDPKKYQFNKKQSPTLAEYFDKFAIKSLERVYKQSTFRERLFMWRGLIEPAIGHVRLNDISTEQFITLNKLAISKGYKTSYARSIMFLLKKVLTIAFDNNDLAYVPDYKMPKKAKVVIKDTLTPEQITKLIEYASSKETGRADYGNLILFLSLTGCRFGEAAALKFSDINYDDMSITIARRVYGTNIDTPKSGKTSKIPLHPALIDVINSQKVIYGERKNEDTKEFIFVALANHHYLHLANFNKFLKRAAKHVGIKDIKISSHIFRRSLATNLIDSGFSVPNVASLMRHSPDMLLKHYAKGTDKSFSNKFTSQEIVKVECERNLKTVDPRSIANLVYEKR